MTNLGLTASTTLRTHLFRHAVRPDWGYAISAGQSESGQKYQFEDGTLRTIATAYAKFMEPAPAVPDAAHRIADLSRKLGVSSLREELAHRGEDNNLLSTEDQIKIFRADYPGGFRDPSWVKDVRGMGAPRPNRKHRNAAIARAQELLAAERLRALIDAGKDAEVIAALVEVLGRTDLASRASEVKPLTEVGPDHQAPVAMALIDLLHGEDDVADRIDRFVAAVEASGARPTWAMVTTPLGLLRPRQHVAVRPTSFKRQAKWMGVELDVSSRPSGASYLQMRQVAALQEQDLVAAGMKPRDFLSIHDFIRLTARTTARKTEATAATQAA